MFNKKSWKYSPNHAYIYFLWAAIKLNILATPFKVDFLN